MHYYKFNISDYKAHTEHLELLEDLAFRRMLDWMYLHEKPLPKNIDEIARFIRMRSHNDCIAYVLREFFVKTKDGFINERVGKELGNFQKKSELAKKSAEARWKKNNSKNNDLANANALQTQCDDNANGMLNTKHKTLNTKQETLTNKDLVETATPKKSNRFKPPSIDEVIQYCNERQNQVDASKFVDYYETSNWMRGKNKIKDWKACVRTWEKNSNNNTQPRFANQKPVGDNNDLSWMNNEILHNENN